MKKKLIGIIVLAVSLIMIICTATFAEADGYEYAIDSIALTDLYGNEIAYTGGSCSVKISVSRAYQTDDDTDYIAVTAYDTEGTLVGFSYIAADALAASGASDFKCTINVDETVYIDRIKALVWDDFSNLKPLAQGKSVSVISANCVHIDGTLVAEQYAAEPGVSSNCLRIRQASDTDVAKEYSLNDATLYVNGVEYCLVSGNEDLVRAALAASIGDTILVEDSANSGYYNRIMMDFYAIARITQVTKSSSCTTLTLSGIEYSPFNPPGTSVTICNDNMETLCVIKNGVRTDLDALKRDDVVAIKYDVNGCFSDSNFIEIIATTDTVTGVYNGYDEELGLYSIDGRMYTAACTLDIDVGSNYIFYLDPFGRLFDYEEYFPYIKEMAIVEKYVENGSSSAATAYDYIQVMTLDGKCRTIYIDNDYKDEVNALMTEMNIKSSVKETARTALIQNRIIEYTAKKTNARIIKIERVTDVECVWNTEYNPNNNILGKSLSSTVVILDATEYDNTLTGNASISSYKASSLEMFAYGVEYSALLIHKNSNNEYDYVVITGYTKYNKTSGFVVAAVNTSILDKTIYEGKDAYKLYVMQNGGSEPTPLYISQAVNVYYDGAQVGYEEIKQGSIFFCTTDSDGLVDEINIVYQGNGVGTSAWRSLLQTDDMSSVVKLPYGSGELFNKDNWGVTIDERDFSSDTRIQLLLAPVYRSQANSVTVAPILTDGAGNYYMDTNFEQFYAVDSSAKIYSIDMSGDVFGRNALSSGTFTDNVNYADIDGNGFGFLYGSAVDDDVENLGETVQMAFMMVVDGAVTNALVFDY